MNLQESYEEYAKTNREITILKAKQRDIIDNINENHLEEVHKTFNSVVKIGDDAFSLVPVIDNQCKKHKEDKDRKLFEFKVQPTKIFEAT